MAETQTPAYVSPLTVESVLELNDHLRTAINTFAKSKDGKMDLFVIMAALSQTAFEVGYNSFYRSDDDKEQAKKGIERVSSGILAKLDGLHAEFGGSASTDILGAAQTLGILAEIHCKRRDAIILQTLAKQQNTASTDVPGESPSE